MVRIKTTQNLYILLRMQMTFREASPLNPHGKISQAFVFESFNGRGQSGIHLACRLRKLILLKLEITMRTSHPLTDKKLVRLYELLWLGYAVAAAIVFVLTDFAFAAIVIMSLLGIALVFGGMMGVLPEIVGDD